jgi:hypothetical protein
MPDDIPRPRRGHALPTGALWIFAAFHNLVGGIVASPLAASLLPRAANLISGVRLVEAGHQIV